MSSNPASLLIQIKVCLIGVGYATPLTPITMVQDSYFRYVVINHTLKESPFIPSTIEEIPEPLKPFLYPEISKSDPIQLVNSNGDIIFDGVLDDLVLANSSGDVLYDGSKEDAIEMTDSYGIPILSSMG